MGKYLLNSEEERVNSFVKDLEQKLNQNLGNLRSQFFQFLQTTYDWNIEDALEYFKNMFTCDFEGLLSEKITPSIQFGLKNEYFTVINYRNDSNHFIDSNTFFQFDSITKTIVSTLIMLERRAGNLDFETTIHELNPDFDCEASIKSILNFTAMMETGQRIDDLSYEETIKVLRRCHENMEEKSKFYHYYQYNDIGFIILRLTIPDFLMKLESILSKIDKNNLTYDSKNSSYPVVGGKIGEEFISPDRKGRDILFPGHTGLSGNITGLLNLFYKITCTDEILTSEEREILLTQPYVDPNVYTQEGIQKMNSNGSKAVMNKNAGFYYKPFYINDPLYRKIASCDVSERTTDSALAASGTCGAWVMSDDLSFQGRFGHYAGGILSNPYGYVHAGFYPNERNPIPNTNLTVNHKGVILGYSGKLNAYKEMITDYGILFELLTQYYKETDLNALEQTSLVLKKKAS